MRNFVPLIALCLALTAGAEPLRLTTWNLDQLSAPADESAAGESSEDRLKASADVLQQLHPDIVVLQGLPDRESAQRLCLYLRPEQYRVAVVSDFKDASGQYTSRQSAVLCKTAALAGWSEDWKHQAGVKPSQGFAFAAIGVGARTLGIYALDLEPPVPTASEKPSREQQIAILKREVSAEQLTEHIAGLSGKLIDAVVLAGTLNTNPDEGIYASEETLELFESAGFTSAFRGIAPSNRVTRLPDVSDSGSTRDFVLVKNANFLTRPDIRQTHVSAHSPVTIEFTLDLISDQQLTTIPSQATNLSEPTRDENSVLNVPFVHPTVMHPSVKRGAQRGGSPETNAQPKDSFGLPATLETTIKDTLKVFDVPGVRLGEWWQLWLVLTLALVLYLSLWAYDRKFRMDPTAPAYGSDRFHAPESSSTAIYQADAPTEEHGAFSASHSTRPVHQDTCADDAQPMVTSTEGLAYLHERLEGASSHEFAVEPIEPPRSFFGSKLLSFLGRTLFARQPVKLDHKRPVPSPSAYPEDKLAQIRPYFQNTHVVYEKRITELEHDLATKAEINRELIRAKIQLLQQSIEMETRQT